MPGLHSSAINNFCVCLHAIFSSNIVQSIDEVWVELLVNVLLEVSFCRPEIRIVDFGVDVRDTLNMWCDEVEGLDSCESSVERIGYLGFDEVSSRC